jgi:hypothetical protein
MSSQRALQPLAQRILVSSATVSRVSLFMICRRCVCTGSRPQLGQVRKDASGRLRSRPPAYRPHKQ